jgi:glycosyltransferase involved in cell wall biosynthesis
MSVSVILTAYKRPYTLQEQITAIKNQTIKPSEIMFCQNGDEQFDETLLTDVTTIRCSNNLGVWARFSYALNCKSDYVCIFDDDTIPGVRWLENCLETAKILKDECLLGTIGVKFKSLTDYFKHERVGWGNPNDNVERVDIVGHSWFFKKELLTTFWRELPRVNQDLKVGEDIHFAYMLQKYANIGCYVPAHPIMAPELWGSIEKTAWSYGRDENALSNEMDCLVKMNDTYKYYVDKGFKVLEAGNISNSSTIVPNINTLWLLYTTGQWSQLYNKASIYHVAHRLENNYDTHICSFFVGYAALELKQYNISKKYYMELLDNKNVTDDIKGWVHSNINLITPVFKHDFTHDFDKLWELINSKKNCVFSVVNSECESEGLNHTEDYYFYGVYPGNLDDPLVIQASCKTTFGNIFGNSNYGKFLLNICELKESVVLVTEETDSIVTNSRLTLLENLSSTDKEKLDQIAKKYTNTLFLITANNLVHHLYESNPSNRYICVGPNLNEILYKTKTEEYMDPYSESAKTLPIWSF